MTAETILALTALIAGVSGIVTAIMSGRASVNKSQFEALQATVAVLSAENKRLLDRQEILMKRIELLECEDDAKQVRINTLEDTVRELESQILALGAVPVTKAKRS